MRLTPNTSFSTLVTMQIGTRPVSSDPTYKANTEVFDEHVRALKKARESTLPGKNDAALKKHTDRDKLFVRDRIAALIDPGTTFLETAPLAGAGLYDRASTSSIQVARSSRCKIRCFQTVSTSADSSSIRLR